ncbi:MAG: lysophospholipid acyltransferase family protein, partial [Alphaproteobacteria bacterium]|nr:lysophospholipid acyltransferase family protein [Alphaproteobacteria bacterium]
AMGGLFAVIGPLTPWHGRAARNMKLALPDMAEAECQRVLSGMWWNLGRVIGEFPHIHRMVGLGRIEFEGLEHLRDLDSGAFLIGAHIGNWELGPYAALKEGHKVAAIYRPLNNQLLSGLLERRQANYGGDIFRKGREAALGMVSALRKGQVMCLLVDQQLREGLPVPFFGHPAQTSISHVKLAIRKKVPLMYMRTKRVGGSRFRITISPPITLPAEDDDATVIAVATEINAEIERWIRATPDQWFWPHRRWGKNLPKN